MEENNVEVNSEEVVAPAEEVAEEVAPAVEEAPAEEAASEVLEDATSEEDEAVA